MLEEVSSTLPPSNPILPSPDKSWDTPPHCYLIFKHKISCIQLQRTRLFVFQIFNEIFIFCSRCSSWKSIDGGENPIRQLSTTLISPKVSWRTMSLQHGKDKLFRMAGTELLQWMFGTDKVILLSVLKSNNLMYYINNVYKVTVQFEFFFFIFEFWQSMFVNIETSKNKYPSYQPKIYFYEKIYPLNGFCLPI